MKKTNWIHIEFWFKTYLWKDKHYKMFNYEEQKDFEKFLSLILLKCFPYYSRKFYLYEPNPHCFLALELKERDLFFKIKKEINFLKKTYLKKINYMAEIKLKRDTGDGNNKDGFIKILDAMADYQLLYQDNSLSHIIHCMLNKVGLTRQEENLLYRLMSKNYG